MRQPFAPDWQQPKPLIGMVHLLPLPGSPRWAGSLQQVLDAAAADAAALSAGGVDGIIVENYGDGPFYPGPVPAETIAAMTAVLRELQRTVVVPIGVNVLRNDAAAALGICAATAAAFVRVNIHTGEMLTDQGRIAGLAHETLRLRARLGLRAAIFADVLVKHASAPAGLTLADAARDTWHRGLADALIVSGPGTGAPTRASDIACVKAAVPEAFVLVGSGLDPENAAALLAAADGAIVGSSIKTDGRAESPVSLERVRRLVAIADAMRPPAR